MKTNYQAGHDAEVFAADYLRYHGYKIHGLNWKTRYCEIDIVAQKEKTIYFVEVKYRLSSAFGRGLDYITNKKLQQMRFAAEFWVAEHDWSGDYSLAALEVSGPSMQVTNFIDEL